MQYDFCYPAKIISKCSLSLFLSNSSILFSPKSLGGPHYDALAHCYVQSRVGIKPGFYHKAQPGGFYGFHEGGFYVGFYKSESVSLK